MDQFSSSLAVIGGLTMTVILALRRYTGVSVTPLTLLDGRSQSAGGRMVLTTRSRGGFLPHRGKTVAETPTKAHHLRTSQKCDLLGKWFSREACSMRILMSATTGSSGSANLTSVSQNTYNPAELSEERAFQTPDCQTVVSSEERQRMRRRLFRALDEPEMPLIAVDCGAMSPDAMRDVLDRFATSPQLRHSYNLVLALPVDQEWLAGETAEWVEDFKSVVFERGFEEKVARIWLHEQHCEWDALTQYVDQYGGLIIDNDTAVEAWPGKPPGVSYRRSMK